MHVHNILDAALGASVDQRNEGINIDGRRGDLRRSGHTIHAVSVVRYLGGIGGVYRIIYTRGT